MKKTILLLPIFIITFYTQAELMPQAEPVQVKTDQEKTGFFSFSLGGEAYPGNFQHHSTTVDIKFGDKISEQSFFTMGVKLETSLFIFLAFQYGYNFTKNTRWIPGVDATLLIGSKSYGSNKDNTAYDLAGGFELGPYLKAYISKTYALLLRSGFSYDRNIDDDFDYLTVYLNLGLQWYF